MDSHFIFGAGAVFSSHIITIIGFIGVVQWGWGFISFWGVVCLNNVYKRLHVKLTPHQTKSLRQSKHRLGMQSNPKVFF